MIKIHRDNRVIFWLLIGGLVLNILWSLRLELQAKTTKTIVEEYHSNLNKKIDLIEGLEQFGRLADKIIICSPDWSCLDVGKIKIKGLGTLTGLQLYNSKGVGHLAMTNEKGTALTDLKGIQLNVGERKEYFQIHMMKDKELIEIRHHDSILRVGKTPQGEGIGMGQKDWGSVVIRKGKGVGIVSTKKIILEARGEHAELSIVSDGDINIRSKNGVVRINGKKIHMNKSEKQNP